MPNNSKMVGVNSRGRRIGENHPGALLTDRDVELMFELREQGWGYGRIAAKLECSKSQVRRVLQGVHRAQSAVRFKRCP